MARFDKIARARAWVTGLSTRGRIAMGRVANIPPRASVVLWLELEWTGFPKARCRISDNI